MQVTGPSAAPAPHTCCEGGVDPDLLIRLDQSRAKMPVARCHSLRKTVAFSGDDRLRQLVVVQNAPASGGSPADIHSVRQARIRVHVAQRLEPAEGYRRTRPPVQAHRGWRFTCLVRIKDGSVGGHVPCALGSSMHDETPRLHTALAIRRRPPCEIRLLDRGCLVKPSHGRRVRRRLKKPRILGSLFGYTQEH